MVAGPIAVITQPRENVCPPIPAFEPAHGLNSEELELAQRQYALDLRRIIRCHVERQK